MPSALNPISKGLGIALLLALVAIWYNYQRAERYQAEAANFKAQRDVAVDALQQQAGILQQCDAATKRLVKLAQDQRAAIGVAIGHVEQLSQELVTIRAAMREQEDRDHEIPACEIVLQTDLSVCPGHTASVRQRASRSLQRSRGRSGGAGADANRPAAGARL